jgi:hypothetical protein
MIRLFLIFSLFTISTLLHSQNALLQTRITLDAENKELEEIFKKITEKYNVHFSYNSKVIQSDKKISIKVSEETLENVLTAICFENELEFAVVRNQIVLKKAKPKPVQIKRFTISGHIRDKETGETLPGATILAKNINQGAISNAYGFFSLSLLPGEYDLWFSFVGYKAQNMQLVLNQDFRFNIELEVANQILAEITVERNLNLENLEKSQSGHLQVNPRMMEKLPEFAGESGLIKGLQTLPGFQTHSDGSSFYFVRGGNKDQNLIHLDEAPVYNPAHLFGFYSVIIPEVAKSIDIYKADIPIEKGGRISSLIDVQTRDGNMQQLNLEGVLNPLMYRFSIESPLIKDKSSFFTSFRRSNFEWIYRQNAPNSKFYIQDFSTKLNWQINDKNRIFFAIFSGKDNYTTPNNRSQEGLAWQNITSTIRWNHIYNNKVFANATLYTSNYDYTLFIGNGPTWNSGIADLGAKYDVSWFLNPDVTYKFGFAFTYHTINPGNITFINAESRPFIPIVYAGKATETALYFNREKRINEKWAWNAGIRLPLWTTMGPAYTFSFDENHLPTDTLAFQDRDVIQRYLVPELRLSARYRLNEKSSVRISWGNYQQNLHLLSNSISPFSSFEIWMPSSRNIKPQRANQLSAGIAGILEKQGLEWSADAYLKNMHNQIEYTEHANLMLNTLIEGELRFGKSQSYGIELSVRKNMGRFTGWAGYTWSRVFNRFDGINQNNKYPAFYDRPHDISIYLSWAASRRIILSANWIYFTGSAITTPVGFYQQNGAVVPLYGEKNNDRLPDYHRLDLSLSWIFGKPSHRYQHSLNFGIFNLYNRTNPISINFNKIKNPDGQYVVPVNQYGSQEILTTQKYLSSFMPSVTYKFQIK